jgi:cytoskeletal protein CcmA (bactofilin family)
MAQVVKLKRSSVAGNVPTTGQMTAGELAMNTADGKLFLRDDSTVRPIVTTGAEITGSINLTGNITASGNISGSITGSFKHLKATTIEGNSPLIIKGVSDLTFADPGDGITFSNTNLFGNPVFHGDINIYSGSAMLDEIDQVIFRSTNTQIPADGYLQLGDTTTPTELNGNGITLKDDTVISGSAETTSHLDVGGSGSFGDKNFYIGTNVGSTPATGFNSTFEFKAGPVSSYDTQLVFRPSGNTTNYNSAYWGSIQWDPQTLQGININSGNYKSNIWFTKSGPGSSNPAVYARFTTNGYLKLASGYVSNYSSADERLHVVGNGKFTGFITASGNIETQGELIGSINGGTF